MKFEIQKELKERKAGKNKSGKD